MPVGNRSRMPLLTQSDGVQAFSAVRKIAPHNVTQALRSRFMIVRGVTIFSTPTEQIILLRAVNTLSAASISITWAVLDMSTRAGFLRSLRPRR